MTLLSVKEDVVNSMESQAISLGRGQAEVTLLFVKQDVVTSMESHFTWQGLSRSDFQHGKSFHLAGGKQK